MFLSYPSSSQCEMRLAIPLTRSWLGLSYTLSLHSLLCFCGLDCPIQSCLFLLYLGIRLPTTRLMSNKRSHNETLWCWMGRSTMRRSNLLFHLPTYPTPLIPIPLRLPTLTKTQLTKTRHLLHSLYSADFIHSIDFVHCIHSTHTISSIPLTSSIAFTLLTRFHPFH